MVTGALLFLASVTAIDAWSGVAVSYACPGLRTSHRSCGLQAHAMAQNAEGKRLDRRALLEFAGKAAVIPVLVGATFPRGASAESLSKDVAEKIAKIPLDVIKAIGGGSDKEFKANQENYESDLTGLELSLYQAYMYAAEKVPETEDPRLSLRPLFQSKMSDNLIKFAEANGVSPKVYDARGDGLTNVGKGGVLKGSKVLLDGLKKIGMLEDYALDTSSHDENKWQQGTSSSVISLIVKKPVGMAAGRALAEEDSSLELSLVGNALAGYLRQCKVVPEFTVEPQKDGDKINFTLTWAGKARLASSIERRSKDKFNTARAFKKEDKKEATPEEADE